MFTLTNTLRAALTGALLLHGSASAAEIPAELTHAFEAMPQVDLDNWRFREVRRNKDGVKIRRYDPAREQPWVLESIDGEAPDSDALEEHAERVAKAKENGGGRPGENDFAGLAQPGSWQLIRQNEAEARYAFRPAADPDDPEDQDILDKMRGELTLDREAGRVRSFKIFNAAPFRARMVAKIQSFETDIRMQEIAPGVHFATRISTRVKGRAFGLKKLDSETLIEYDQFERVDDVAPGASSDAD